jgi:hypothetical protein
MGKSDCSVESFVRIIISKTDLEFDGLNEFALLAGC